MIGLLRRVLRRSSPAWASFLSPGEYEAFEAALHADLRARGWAFRQHDDGITVEDPTGPDAMEYGLTNLAQVCGGSERSDWPGIIRGHFDHMEALRAEPEGEPRDWEAARPLLRLRLFGPEFGPLDHLVTYPVAPDVVAALALDLPTTVTTFARDAIAGWPPVDELHAIALDNVRAEPAPDPETIGAPPAAITALIGESFFVATRLLFLPEVIDLSDTAHAIVAVPNRHTLLAHAIRTPDALTALSVMVQIAVKLHRDGPGSIVPTVFWWHRGALTPIPAEIDGKGVSVWPPDAFLELINTLAPAADG